MLILLATLGAVGLCGLVFGVRRLKSIELCPYCGAENEKEHDLYCAVTRIRGYQDRLGEAQNKFLTADCERQCLLQTVADLMGRLDQANQTLLEADIECRGLAKRERLLEARAEGAEERVRTLVKRFADHRAMEAPPPIILSGPWGRSPIEDTVKAQAAENARISAALEARMYFDSDRSQPPAV